MAIISIYDLSEEQVNRIFEGKTKIPGIIDADEAVGECDMNYDHELVAYQARNPETCERDYSGASVYSANRTERDFSPVELERDVKMSLKKKLDELR